MAKFLYNGPCIKCGSSDACSHYSDGSTWCWSCRKASGRQHIPMEKEEEKEEKPFSPPYDLTQDFPQEVVEFIKPYDLTIAELIKNAYFWSPYSGNLWRRVSQDVSGRPSCWESRHCSSTTLLEQSGSQLGRSRGIPKSRFFGSKENCFPITKEESSGTKCMQIVLTEDSLSAIKVGRVCDAMPLFGVSISKEKLTKLMQEFGYQSAVVWLDHDKFKEAYEIAEKFQWLGYGARIVFSELDPKYYCVEKIKEFIK